jgi:hypothetical protein
VALTHDTCVHPVKFGDDRRSWPPLHRLVSRFRFGYLQQFAPNVSMTCHPPNICLSNNSATAQVQLGEEQLRVVLAGGLPFV